MRNRELRRALERAAKKTHKLQPQVCVLWVPSACGYLEQFGVDGFAVVDHAELAQRFCEHQACSAAVMLRKFFGARAEVRPFLSIAHRRRCSVDPIASSSDAGSAVGPTS